MAMEITRAPAGCHNRTPVVLGRPLPAVRVRGVFVLDLLASRIDVSLMLRDSFAFVFAYLDSVRSTVVAHVVHVIHHHRAVVIVVNHRDVHVRDRAIVDKLPAAPLSAPKTYSRIAVT